jgi:hypothetical protein
MYIKAGLILVVSLLCIPLVSCTTGTDEQELSASLDEFSTFDLDNDGENDKYVYKFAEEEISGGVYLTRTIEVQEGDTGTEGKISLQFDDRSQGNDYRHVENIPKEFASHVDELQFSVPPDEIINPDPEVAWDKEQIDIGAGYLIDITKNLGKWNSEGVITMTATTVLQYSKVKFARMERGSERDKAVLQTASQLTNMMEMWEHEQKVQLCSFCSQPYTRAACCAILMGDTKECDDPYLDKQLSEEDIDLCRGIYIQDKCEDIADKEAREECFLENAIDIGCEIACGAITNKDKRNLCLAVVKDDFEYCEKIEDQEIYDQCCKECGRSPDGSLLLRSFSCDSDCPNPPEGFTKSCKVTEEDDYSILSCEYIKTMKCKDWRYSAGLTDEEYTDCTVADIDINIYQCESEEVAENLFKRLIKGAAGDSKYYFWIGESAPTGFYSCDTFLTEYTLDGNCIVQIEVHALGESEAEELFNQIKPSAMSIISKN